MSSNPSFKIENVSILSGFAKIKSRHFCKNGKCRLFCRMKMCYNISESREFILLRRWKFELY